MASLAPLMPHRHCYAGDKLLELGMAGSDAITGVVYLAIFVGGLVKFRQSHLVFTFSLFIGLCGLNHLVAVVTNYVPFYHVELTVKAAMAVVSVYALGLVLVKRGTFIGVYRNAERHQQGRV